MVGMLDIREYALHYGSGIHYSNPQPDYHRGEREVNGRQLLFWLTEV